MKTISNEAEELFDLVKSDFFKLRIEWRIYRCFWGTNKETFDMLHSISPNASGTLETIVFERILLGLRKLTDPPKSKKRLSVTVRALPEHFDDESKSLVRLIGNAINSSSFAKNWSDRRIAHSDLAYRQGLDQLQSASRSKVEQALEDISEVIKWISKVHYDTTLLTHPIPDFPSEQQFLLCLYEGQKALKQREIEARELIRQRKYDERDALFSIPSWLERVSPPFDES